ncbi:RNA polymerase sigma factor (sigma-70 family) [Microbacteriaceae bacterium MWH-Ta3]|nr:RNA polymerase sigma factor (sigma-70 family) [Microbacteriaceae bacterium MWH-Ta3]
MTAASELPQELLGRFHNGDHAAFRAVFDTYASMVNNIARAHGAQSSELDDIVQDVFVILWEKRRVIAAVDQSLAPWLVVTTINMVRNRLRKLKRRRTDSTGDMTVFSQRRNRSDDFSDLVYLQNEIAHLTELQQNVIQLCVVSGYRYSDAARILGMSQSMIRKTLERARIRLRSRWEDNNESVE